MSDDRRERAVPRGRISRLSRFGRMAGGVAGGMLSEGARRLAAGERPKLSDLALTPGNMTRVADQLSQLRGAAMKLGQMISMDTGDMLPPELTEILGRVRDRAYHMPPKQLKHVLAAEWGENWRGRFALFQPSPIAAASIGQVHRARLPDGRELAIKVQYPGVAESIDADVDNVATLLRVSGVLPKTLNITPMLTEAKRQLHQEADYIREGAQMERFRAALADDERFVVPALEPDLTTPRVLAMTFEEGRPIESLVDAPQDERDRVTKTIIDLVLLELFIFGFMQTDPNFANYRYQPESGRIVLLDFGAAGDVSADTAARYANMLRAGLGGEREELKAAALAAGFFSETIVQRHGDFLNRALDLIIAELNRPGPFDFGDRAFVKVLRQEGMEVAADRQAWHLPPVDTVFVQRKISGTALLGARLKAKVDVRSMVADTLGSAD
ncbi:MAG: AarF/ABC1/UbiB kinase family protein [Pacificimonas sp.]|jgi:predicted unusual protein kinase regulating ubiquinone biosynthesis (AarF/ABC1/UbiB family)|nr:AarF/ABC1/UbiB kinase family protein [Pacificimonas sp.]